MKIFCVDRSPWSLLKLKRAAKSVAPEAVICSCKEPKNAVALARTEGCDVLLTEMDFGGQKWEGLDFAKAMKDINPHVNIIFVTALSERDVAKEVIQLRVSGFITKPYEPRALVEEFANLRYAVS